MIFTYAVGTGILDYLREGFPWPTRPFKHTETNSFKHPLVFHTTSRALWSGSPSTCLNIVTLTVLYDV